jgi:hypothetical protein
MKIIYYSRGSLIPALFCAAKHNKPDSTPEQTLQGVQAWLKAHRLEQKKVLLLPYGEGAAGVSLFVMTAAAPPGLVERTLANLFSLLEGGAAPEPFVLVSSLPFSRSGSADEQAALAQSKQKLQALWPEIGAAVKQARLQIALMKRLR